MLSSKSVTASSIPTNPSNHSKLKLQQESELDRLNARLRNVSDKIITPSPYLLTVPGERSYRLNSLQTIDWTKNTPFSVNEGELQYVSFLRRELGDSLITAVGGWDNEKGELVDASPNGIRGVKSGTSTPKQGGKKMTLADYKNKKAGIQPASQDVVKTNGAEAPCVPLSGGKVEQEKGLVTDQHQQQSRKRTVDTLQGNNSSPVTTTNQSSEPPAKKSRSSPSLPLSTAVNTRSSVPPKLIIPTLLSPTLPSVVEEELARLISVSKSKTNKSETGGRRLPSITSPSKPTSSKPDPSPPKSTLLHDSKEPPAAKKISRTEEKSNTQKNLFTKEQAAKGSKNILTPTQKPRERSISGSKINSDKAHLANTPVTKNVATSAAVGAKAEKSVTTKDARGSKEITGKRRLVVRLKIPKARRKDVSRLLQMPPAKSRIKPVSSIRTEEKVPTVNGKGTDKNRSGMLDKEQTQPTSEKRTTTGQKSVIRREIVTVSSSGSSKPKEKRARPEDDTATSLPQSKRSKHPSGLDLSQKVKTPVPPPFKSPIVSVHGSGQKFQDSKNVPTRRLEVGDADVKTPQGSVRGGTPLAPNSVERVTRDGRSASITSSAISAVSEESNAWKTEHKRLFLLGRKLKHEADDYDLQWKEKDEPEFEKKAIATSIECVLCFMLAYTILDEIKAPGRSSRKAIDFHSWETIFGFIQLVKRRSQGHTLIHGLCLQLEAVCHNLILVAKVDQLASIQPPITSANEETVQPTKQAALATEPASKGSQQSRTLEEYMQHKEKIAEHGRFAQNLWIDGTFELSIDDLQQSFPASWKRKSRAPLARSKEKLTLGNLNGDFYLPLSNITTGIEAIRAGWSLLGEWCKNENVNWVGKVGL